MKPNDDAERGFTFRYRGEIYEDDGSITFPQASEPGVGVEEFIRSSSGAGAAVMRLNLGFRTRSAHLQQSCIWNEAYQANPVDIPGDGADELLFRGSPSENTIYNDTMRLCSVAHGSLGRTKITNERTQGVVNSNKQSISGEQSVWYSGPHSIVWNIGNLVPRMFDENGFSYFESPKDITPDRREEIRQSLVEKKFTRETDGNIRLIDDTLLWRQNIHGLQVTPFPDFPHTSRLLVSSKKDVRATGFILHRARMKTKFTPMRHRQPLEQHHVA